MRTVRFLERVSPSSRLVIGAISVALAAATVTGTPRTPPAGSTIGAPPAASPVRSLPPSPPSPVKSPPQVAAGRLADALALLRVAPETLGGYERDLFKQWIDEDGDGCDTRREVLMAEAVVFPTLGSNCALVGGQWLSVYDGATFTSADGLDVDHVVPLAEAWRSGASTWTPDRRMRFANDLDVEWSLAAVSANSDRAKGDQDPAEWLPPLDSFACTYAAWWIEVKVRWSLTIDKVEQEKLEQLASRCLETPASVVIAP